MKERPMIFSGEMVEAILGGRKTMTRRPIKKHPLIEAGFVDEFIKSHDNNVKDDCPYGQPGDKLWVKETWGIYSTGEDGDLVKYKVTRQNDIIPGHCIVFKASDSFGDLKGWRSPRFMPKWVSRITLEIVKIRVERLQEITDDDALSEGCIDIRYAGNDLHLIYPSRNS